MSKQTRPDHWADRCAEQIVRQRGPRDRYVCASGITPSGTVHIGNFREIISVELVVRALRDLGHRVRFIYSWDDFDVFRKVPANMPKRDELAEYLRRPITHVPDPHGRESSYARANEVAVEAVLHRVGIDPEYLYQADKYAAGVYADGMVRALERESDIRGILNEHRTTPLSPEWSPVSVFCSSCDRDTTVVDSSDGYALTYHCTECDNRETLDLRESAGAKLLWRVDWPMRWHHEQVDFEPAGKEHHSAGGSFDTAKQIVREIYEDDPPVTFKYDFISIKGMGGKISSSIGNVISLEDVLEVYEPPIVRFLFAGTRPDTEFAISFDLDVIKIYEDYDRCERVHFGEEEVGEKKRAKQSRIYELSQVDAVPERMPFQLPFRHLCNLLQINSGDIEAAIEASGVDLGSCSEAELVRLRTRAQCAWTWITNHAPEDFRFALRGADDPRIDLDECEAAAISSLAEALDKRFGDLDEKQMGELYYAIAEEHGIDAKQLFCAVYRVLLGKERGPRLASFMLTAGRDRIVPILTQYRSGETPPIE